MTTKTVYLFDEATGEFKGAYDAQESPLEPGDFITPTSSTDQPPPEVDEGATLHFIGGAWELRKPTPPEPEPPIPAPTPLELIQQLEADNPFTHRNLRDLTLGALKLAAMATGGKLEDNPAALKVMALEQQIAILRGEL